MSVLIPFDKCIARPNEGNIEYSLKAHLSNVKQFMKQWNKDEDPILEKLLGLSGICHDIAKSHKDWQSYIRNPQKRKGPTHAPAGAFLFSFLAYKILEANNEWKNYRIHWLWLIRDIADHHSSLQKLDHTNWIKAWDWNKMDLNGIGGFIQEQYPELSDLKLNEEILDDWIDRAFELVEEVMDELDLGYDPPPPLNIMKCIQFWRHLTTGLIAGDRFDVKDTDSFWLDKELCRKSDEYLEEFCQSNEKHSLFYLRSKAQREILKQLENNFDERFYTLEMPTGYGKTITALKIALWFGLNQGYQKIIYVAPYLSILEQTSEVIEKSMKIGVLEHHSLAILENDKNAKENIEQRAPKEQLAMESWAHSVVCTSFQQFSKALFPKSSQNVLRRSFLKDSIVIIDEPQIFDPAGWNVFLCGLEALAEQYNLKIIFLSATMPTFEYGLKKEPARLSFQSSSQYNRYKIVNTEEMDECKLAKFLIQREEKTQAAILNTIEDAYRVYKEFDETKNIYLIHGLMIPLHKKITINKIKSQLKNPCKEPLYVVSTQIIEAGVDISFEHVARALPILPSIIQAAGRVNRHLECDQGILSVVPFLRGGEKDTRNSIYAKNLQNITDELILQKEVWLESEVMELIQNYYDEMFRQNTYEAQKEAIRKAYEGDWEELAQFQPFGKDYYRLPIFVPWKPRQDEIKFIPRQLLKLQELIGVSDPEEIYDLYKDRDYINNLSFEERKRFMILFHYYVLNVPAKLALRLGSKEDYLQKKVPILVGDNVYNQTTGLTVHFIEGEFDPII